MAHPFHGPSQTLPPNEPGPDPAQNAFQPPFVAEARRQDRTPDGSFIPAARLVLMPALRTGGLWHALPGEEIKTLLLVLTFLAPDGSCRPALAELAPAMRLSESKARGRLERLAAYRWQGAPVLRELPRDSGLDAFVPAPSVLAAAGPPLEAPQEAAEAPLRRRAGREAVIARSRALYARPRAEVEREMALRMGWEDPEALRQEREREEAALTDVGRELLLRLLGLGVERAQALEMLAAHGPDPVRRQIEWLPLRGAKNPARFLAAAVQGDYDPPAGLRASVMKSETMKSETMKSETKPEMLPQARTKETQISEKDVQTPEAGNAWAERRDLPQKKEFTARSLAGGSSTGRRPDGSRRSGSAHGRGPADARCQRSLPVGATWAGANWIRAPWVGAPRVKTHTTPAAPQKLPALSPPTPAKIVPYPQKSVPFPADLLDRAMPALTDTEWRLLCVVVRQTLGWQDAATGGRKERDWLTQAQLVSRTGRTGKPVSQAVNALVLRGLIRVLSEQGRPLVTPAERRRYSGRHWFQLHPEWAGAVRNGEESRGGGYPKGGGPQEGGGGSLPASDGLKARASNGWTSDGRASQGLSAVEKVPTTKESVNKRNFFHSQPILSRRESPQAIPPSAWPPGRRTTTDPEGVLQGPWPRPRSGPCLRLDDVLTVSGPGEPAIRQADRQWRQARKAGPGEGGDKEDLEDASTGGSEDQPAHCWKWSRDQKQWITGE